MDDPTWQKVCIIMTALLCATAVEIVAILQGFDGYLLAGYLGIVGSVAGVPVGIFLERKKRGSY